MLPDAFSLAAFLRSPDPAALAGRLGEELRRRLLAGESRDALLDALGALGHRFDFNDQWSGDDWFGEVWISPHLHLEYRLDAGPAPGGPPAGVDLAVRFSR